MSPRGLFTDMRSMHFNCIFLSAILILLPLSGCLDEDLSSRTETAEDGTERCWAIIQTITSMEHESEMMRNYHYTMTNLTYDASCNMIHSSWWGGDGYGGYPNISYNDEGQPILIQTGSSEWNNTTATLEEDPYIEFEEYHYENGLLMQLKTYYEDGAGEEYWNYTYDSEGREILEETEFTTKESFYTSNGLLSFTKKIGYGNSTTYANYTYDDAGQMTQMTSTYGYGGTWYQPTYTNYTYVDDLLVSSSIATSAHQSPDVTTYTYNENGDLLTQTLQWGSNPNASSTITHSWGYADTV